MLVWQFSFHMKQTNKQIIRILIILAMFILQPGKIEYINSAFPKFALKLEQTNLLNV